MGFLKGIWCTALSSINNRWKKLFDSNEVFGAILTDLSKTFDRICHDLLDTKLNAYSALSLPALKVTQDYLLNQKQRTKTGPPYSTWCSYIWCSSGIDFRTPIV